MSGLSAREREGLASLAAWSSLLPRERLVIGSAIEPALSSRGFSLERATVGPHDLLSFRHGRLRRSFVCVPGAKLSVGMSEGEIEEILRLVGPGDDADAVRSFAKRSRPVRRVSVQPFLVSRTPLLARSDAEILPDPDPDAERPYFGEGDVPVHLTAAEARVVLDTQGEGFRLPSEAEWELLAREGGSSAWLGGRISSVDDLEARLVALYEDAAYRDGRREGEGELGVWGMVFGEWVGDGWHGSYEAAPLDGAAWEPAALPETTRGGGGATYPWQARFEVLGCHAAFRDRADGPRCTSGVRLAMSLP